MLVNSNKTVTNEHVLFDQTYKSRKNIKIHEISLVLGACQLGWSLKVELLAQLFFIN